MKVKNVNKPKNNEINDESSAKYVDHYLGAVWSLTIRWLF